MRQLLYVSSSKPIGQKVDVHGILEQSRHNNAIDGVTGLLWTDGARFLQVLEGPRESVAAAFDRIRADERHQNIVVLFDRAIEEREFGDWSMEYRRPEDDANAFDARVYTMVESSSDAVRSAFIDLIATRTAA